jgi:hypothetical protein
MLVRSWPCLSATRADAPLMRVRSSAARWADRPVALRSPDARTVISGSLG